MVRHAPFPPPPRLLAACLWACLAGPAPAAEGQADIAGWIAQLGSPQFAQRETASRHLVQAGRPALDAVGEAIRTGDLEVASRGIEIVRELLAGDDLALAAEAERLLARCAADDSLPAGRLAAAAVEFHALGMGVAARERLEALGAVFRDRPASESRGIDVEFTAAWRGAAADFRHLARLRHLSSVSVYGVPVDDEILTVLAGLGGVQRIDLFGTGAGHDAARMLAEKLPDARIDVRKGGKLGVSSLSFSGPCEIRTVEPGSAADQAGLRSGDVFLSINGSPVASFAELTTRLSDCAPGEAVKLVIARGGGADGDEQRIECEVRLDSW
jgi:hypothetical protein